MRQSRAEGLRPSGHPLVVQLWFERPFAASQNSGLALVTNPLMHQKLTCPVNCSGKSARNGVRRARSARSLPGWREETAARASRAAQPTFDDTAKDR